MTYRILMLIFGPGLLVACADETNDRLDQMNEKLERIAAEASTISEGFESLESAAKTAEALFKEAHAVFKQEQTAVHSVETNQPKPLNVQNFINHQSEGFFLEDEASVNLFGNACATGKLDQAYDSLIDYQGYVYLSKGVTNITGVGPLIEMKKAEIQALYSLDQFQLADVRFSLKPLRVNRESLFPNFSLVCLSYWTSEKSFIQLCALDEKQPTYALQHFRSLVQVATDSDETDCGDDEVFVSYRLEMKAQPDELHAIKEEALFGSKLLAATIGRLFDEGTFFRRFYNEFYQRWLDGLSETR